MRVAAVALLVLLASRVGSSQDCFCELAGQLSDCECSIESVDDLNNGMAGTMDALLHTDFFKFYKVNLNRNCPFWPEEGACASKGCSVEPCDPQDIPFDGEETLIADCGEADPLGDVTHTITAADSELLENWKAHDASKENYCEPDDVISSGGQFVNLLDNPERFTGYVGPGPAKVWRSIYSENCFQPEEKVPFLTEEVVGAMCKEKRVYYRIMSGLHACINMHVAADYPTQPKGFPPQPLTWGPNITMFEKFFDPAKTWGEGPGRIKNMYFTFLVVLRAVVKAKPLWDSLEFHSGNAAINAATKQLVLDLVAQASNVEAFDESALFNSAALLPLKEEFRGHFFNVSKIMDCVGCEKCKLWGKLQIQGLGTAMKILFSYTEDQPQWRLQSSLRRNEIVSLFVTLGRFSQGIREVGMFRQLQKER
eukprot:m.84083 g.84083  ORF g.84083 m.84083 type:complete len:424 (+) comp14787_c0_seq2:4126-5397(+)